MKRLLKFDENWHLAFHTRSRLCTRPRSVVAAKLSSSLASGNVAHADSCPQYCTKLCDAVTVDSEEDG